MTITQPTTESRTGFCEARAIARPRGVPDPIRAVDLAGREGLSIVVRGSGEEAFAHCLVVDLSLMKAIVVNPHIATVRVEAGATWSGVDRATRAHGLAVPAATSPTRGLATLALGGGEDDPTRPYGPELDSLIEAAVVLLDGSLVRANAIENADLFSAIQAGSLGFGVISSFLFRAERTAGAAVS